MIHLKEIFFVQILVLGRRYLTDARSFLRAGIDRTASPFTTTIEALATKNQFNVATWPTNGANPEAG
jgi:hypothetical protein